MNNNRPFGLNPSFDKLRMIGSFPFGPSLSKPRCAP